MLESGILASKLPNLNYIDTININVLELIIEPAVIRNENGTSRYSEEKADISFTCKIDTSSVRNQMAIAMDTPLFLLNMIVPETLYIRLDYTIEKNEQGEWASTNGFIGVNGRTAKDSEVLLNLLIDFVFPVEEEMSLDTLSSEFGNILVQGVELLGNISIKAEIGSNKDNGIILTI